MNRAHGGRDATWARVAIVGVSLSVAAAVAVATYVLPAPKGASQPNPLATINAALNAGSALCLLLGFACVRRRELVWHKRFMLGAFGLSSVFLITYLMHHVQVGEVHFQGTGALRLIYLGVLVPHIVLAAVVVPLALFTIYRGLSGRIASHKRVVRWTFPIWLYVSISGVAVYFMLYHL